MGRHVHLPPARTSVISFDPGVSTGVAVIDLLDGSLLYSSVVQGDPERIEEEITHLKDEFPHAQVVAEKPPVLAGNYRQHIQQIEERIRASFENVEWVRPSQWKGHPASRVADLTGKTQHEKDAVALARWFRRTRRNGGNKP
jgi:predicted RNase H-like nuclease (RuvC/YqgF family)